MTGESVARKSLEYSKSMENRQLRVGIRCDVGSSIGVGHLMRSASLAEEMLVRGWHVEFSCDAASVPLAESRLAELGCTSIPALQTPMEHLRWLSDRRLDATVIDSYTLDPRVSRVITTKAQTLSFIDGNPRGQSASIYLDQNYGAERLRVELSQIPSPRALRLAGTGYAVLSDRIRKLRPSGPSIGTPQDGRMKVVVALGGTDAADVTGFVVAALKRCPSDLDVTVVSRRLADRADEITESGQRYVYRTPSLQFPEWLAASDLVVSAAGTSLWELCCLGKPVVALAVVDNQLDAYRGLVADGVICGLGEVWTEAPSVEVLSARLREIVAGAGLRNELAQRAFSLVDGAGRVRAVDALEALLVP